MRFQDLCLDPLPMLVTIQFEGEDEKFVPNGGAIFTEPQMDAIVDSIAKMVARNKKPAVIRWQQASKGTVTRHQLFVKGG